MGCYFRRSKHCQVCSQERTDQATEYSYDDVGGGLGNGNLVADANKGIVSVQYNHLNLPVEVWMNAGGTNRIVFTYSAAGVKLKKQVYEAGILTEWTDYAGGMVYRRDRLEFIATEEGRALHPQMLGNGGTAFAYEYHYKDHLGNLRLAFRQPKPTVTWGGRV